VSTPDDRPWERSGEVRRDARPHRGVLLSRLEKATVTCTIAAGCLLLLTVPPALMLAGLTLVLAGRDLATMRAGLMDPAGRVRTEEAKATALACLLVNLLLLAGVVMFVIF
jgi:hypothetical protein